MGKILDGLKEALSYVRGDCRHEFTYWEPGRVMPGTESTKAWRRTCTKCKVGEVQFSEIEPQN